MVTLFWQDWKLSLVALIVGPLIFVLLRYVSRKMKSVMASCQESFASILSRVKEVYEAHRLIKISNTYKAEYDRFLTSIMKSTNDGANDENHNAWNSSVSGPMHDRNCGCSDIRGISDAEWCSGSRTVCYVVLSSSSHSSCQESGWHEYRLHHDQDSCRQYFCHSG